MADTNKSKYAPFWVIVLLLLFILGGLVLFSDVFTGSGETSQEPRSPSTEWTTAPEEGVEVELPETPLRTVEPEDEPAEEDAMEPTE